MSSMRYTKNFMWMNSECIGTGASGFVYKGFDMRDGKAVAIKAYKHIHFQEIVELQQKEYEILKDLSHENVVKLLSFEIEENSPKRNNVLVMEFCNGGNLYEVLLKPENFYGFEQEELLDVLKHITAAMKYLRERHLIHRDIKPLNIMRHKLDNNQFVNKLADFGTARYLNDSQDFDSVHGTKAYLFIKMYEKRVMRKNQKQTFKSTVDLWSIGVTLYHLATGVLPFRSVSGEFSSKEIMYNIIMGKDIGDISGVENWDESITYSKELPDTCLINGDPKVLMTRLLAGLLEYNEDLMWTFDTFFTYVTEMFQQKAIHVFYVNKSKHICFYMNPEQTVDDLKRRICEQTKSRMQNLLLLWDNTSVLFQSNTSEKLSSVPDTSLNHPLLVLDLTETCWSCLFKRENDSVVKFSGLLSFLLVTDKPNLKDYFQALKKVSVESHSIKRFISKIVRCHKALLKTEVLFKSWLVQGLRELQLKIDCLNQKFNCIEGYKYEMLKKSFGENLTQLSPTWKKLNKEFLSVDIICNKFNCDFGKINEIIFQKETRTMESSILSSTELEGCIETANTYVKRLQDSFDAYKRSINQTAIHQGNLCLTLERIQIKETVQSLSALQMHCLSTLKNEVKTMQDWFSHIQGSALEYTRLKTEFGSINRKLDVFSNCLVKARTDLFRTFENVTPQNETSDPRISYLQESNNNIISLDSQNKLTSRKKPFKKALVEIQKLEDGQKSLCDDIVKHNILVSRFASLFSDVNMCEVRLENDDLEI